jgi:hypothetical protein
MAIEFTAKVFARRGREGDACLQARGCSEILTAFSTFFSFAWGEILMAREGGRQGDRGKSRSVWFYHSQPVATGYSKM